MRIIFAIYTRLKVHRVKCLSSRSSLHTVLTLTRQKKCSHWEDLIQSVFDIICSLHSGCLKKIVCFFCMYLFMVSAFVFINSAQEWFKLVLHIVCYSLLTLSYVNYRCKRNCLNGLLKIIWFNPDFTTPSNWPSTWWHWQDTTQKSTLLPQVEHFGG